MKRIYSVIFTLCIVLTLCFDAALPAFSAEIDDAAVFVEAFNAYQQKDYLLTIEKCEQLNQVFPDSPLRDVTLLLIARASLKAGDNERAAKSATQFSTEFPDSSLKTSIEDELKVLAGRQQKGEVLTPDKTLQASAKKVKADRIARVKAAEMKLEAERLAKIKAEQEKLARIKLEEERREKERLAAEKLAKSAIKTAISLSLRDSAGAVAVGSNGTLPVEITNRGKSSEELVMTVEAAKEHAAVISRSGNPDDAVSTLSLAAGETFKGSVVFRMPVEMVDGHRSPLTLKAVSARYADISFQKETVIVSSAPLVRAVAKLTKQKVTPGEKLGYRVTVLNAGSLPAQELTVRVMLPSQLDFQGAPETPFKVEQDGTIVFKVDRVDVGRLSELNFDVLVRDNTPVGQELRGQVEVVNGILQRKDIFTARASTVSKSP